MELVVERPAIVCRLCPGAKTDVIAVEGRQVLRCRACRRTWPPYGTSPPRPPATTTPTAPSHPNTERTAALADFLHTYNHHRCHTAPDGHPPITRVNNAAGQYT
ncbi:hypothetical protein SNE510_63330 [Streptomyces sp. NE5-10]|nr:hypothetical protein [Streptomyces sp. NE5-10]GHJ96814.1 hypothetical protein SNE510_63330 [Streptomyces sp. NE5-10]